MIKITDKVFVEEKINHKTLFPAVLVLFVALLVITGANPVQTAFAESDAQSQPKILVADHLKNNPLAMKIIVEMEAQKLRYKQLMQGIQPIQPTLQQIEVQEKRKIAQSILEQDLESMNKKYQDFTPRNAFARFVSSLNSTYHGIFWDQFEYLDAKVKLATAAKNTVLENGGTFYEAQQEYFKYASMPRLEMISYIQELNVRHGFSEQNTQNYFDAYGKLPRFENDDDAPCYGCKNSSSANGLTSITVQNQLVSDTKQEIRNLQSQLSQLRQKFLGEGDLEEKKFLVNSMNAIVKKIQELTYSGKNL